MKRFLSDMNLARWIILGSILGSLLLGWFGWRLHQRRTELEQALVKEVPELAREIQTLSRHHSRLYKDSGREQLKAQDDPMSYIRRLATLEDVQLGAIDINGPQETEPVRGVLDKKYVLRPQTRDKGVQRLRLANFLYMLENQSRRVRVTHIRMEPEQKSVKPHDVTSDLWKWEVEVTSRQKKEGT